MSAWEGKALVMRGGELAVLLVGFDIRGLYLPMSVATELTSELDVIQALSGMVRDGLMPMNDEGMIVCDGILAEALHIMQECRFSLVVREEAEVPWSRIIYVSADGSMAASISQDSLRTDAICLAVLGIEGACKEIAELIRGYELRLDESVDNSLTNELNNLDYAHSFPCAELIMRGSAVPAVTVSAHPVHPTREQESSVDSRHGQEDSQNMTVIRAMLEGV